MSSVEKKRRHGPEPKPPEEQRNHRYSIYFTDVERKDLVARAFPHGTEGLSDRAISRGVGRYMRDAALNRVPPTIPAINLDAWQNLSRAAANLNQAQAVANKLDHAELAGFFHQLHLATQQYRKALIGASDSNSVTDDSSAAREADHES